MHSIAFKTVKRFVDLFANWWIHVDVHMRWQFSSFPCNEKQWKTVDHCCLSLIAAASRKPTVWDRIWISLVRLHRTNQSMYLRNRKYLKPRRSLSPEEKYELSVLGRSNTSPPADYPESAPHSCLETSTRGKMRREQPAQLLHAHQW